MKKRTGRALTGRNAARARIARDALLQMRLGKLQSESGTYGQFPDLGRSSDVPVCDLLSKLRPCQACAKGALFVGFMSTRRVPVSTFRVLENKSIPERFAPLQKMFGPNFHLIEAYFEGDFQSGAPEAGRMTIQQFRTRYGDDEGRLKAILRSICRNGKFVPPRVGA